MSFFIKNIQFGVHSILLALCKKLFGVHFVKKRFGKMFLAIVSMGFKLFLLRFKINFISFALINSLFRIQTNR